MKAPYLITKLNGLDHKNVYNLLESLNSMIDIKQKKAKIISYIEMNGPSLPVRIAKAIEMDPVFASAILSELLSAKQIKMSNLKIGASSLYLIPGQEQKLEEHTENLKSIENDAYIKLKEKKLLDDEKEAPAIRVALRSIKDFAIPFKFENKIMWKYTFTPDEEIEKILNPRKEEPKVEEKQEIEETAEAPKAWEAKKEEIKEAKEESKKIESIFTAKEESKKKSRTETFLEQIEKFLEKQDTKITSIEEVDKKKVIAKIESDSETALLFAFSKARITEQELMKCYKQAKSKNLPYHLIILGDLTKKMNETINAYKKLTRVDKLDI